MTRPVAALAVALTMLASSAAVRGGDDGSLSNAIPGKEPAHYPGVWERARAESATPAAPTTMDPEWVHRRATLLYTDAEEQGGPFGPLGAIAIVELEGARSLLERVGARTANDPRLRFDLGRILTALRACVDATNVLRAAIRHAPQDVQVGAAWFEVAICESHLGHHDEEEKAYLAMLDVETAPSFRAIVYSNLAESRMALGKMDLAVEAGEQALALRPGAILPRWTLSVVRDRAGDPAGALDEARIAVGSDPEFEFLDDDRDVFFEPAYDRNWYHGLGELALAELARVDGDEYRKHLLKALAHFEAYATAAPTTDRFRALAIEHVSALEKQMGLAAGPPKTPAGKPPATATPPKTRPKK